MWLINIKTYVFDQFDFQLSPASFFVFFSYFFFFFLLLDVFTFFLGFLYLHKKEAIMPQRLFDLPISVNRVSKQMHYIT